MNRIPVGETIRFAYAFAFGQVGAIIGFVWLPLALAAILQFLPYALGTADSDGTAATVMGSAVFNLSMALGVWLLNAMNFVSVTRLALGTRESTISLYFSLGAPEWRMFMSILLCLFALVLLLGLYLATGAVLAGMLGSDIAAAIYAAIGLVGVAYVALRLVFLVPAVVVVEGKTDLVRAWALAAGNVGRIFLVFLAVVFPILILQTVALGLLVGHGLFAPLPMDPKQAMAALEARRDLLDQHAPTVIGVALVLSPFNLGLVLGAITRAYRALAPERVRTPV
ncbi:MAG TPA: hypothetical protein VGF97_12230 [Rhizomicrobium sp.]|jgi:hypothetical protein